MALEIYQRRRRQLLALLLVAAFGAILFTGSRLSETSHEALEIVGLALIAIGIVGRTWCTFYIGGRKSAEIVESGPYSMTRNPLYVFSTIAAAGVGAQSGSVTVMVIAGTACALAFAIVVRREERYLLEKFGDTYRDYLAKVPRFWPNLNLFADRREITVRPRRIYTTLADGLVFLAAIPLLETVEWAQHAGIIRVLLRLP